MGDQSDASHALRTLVLTLEQYGSFMESSKLGISDKSRQFCTKLLDNEQQLPRGTHFDEDAVCSDKAMVVRHILPLIVPPAKTHTKGLGCLVDSAGKEWISQPITKDHLKPDYSVGFNRCSFTDEQFNKIGGRSLFMATSDMCFPFLTCDVRSCEESLVLADCQNTRSMTLAVRAIVEVFRLANRESELDGKFLAFSISHDHDMVRIYGHYPAINNVTAKTEFYRHQIRSFSLTDRDGTDRWTAYRFIKNVYDLWASKHFKYICSAIDQLPPQPALKHPGALVENKQLSQSIAGGIDHRRNNATADT